MTAVAIVAFDGQIEREVVVTAHGAHSIDAIGSAAGLVSETGAWILDGALVAGETAIGSSTLLHGMTLAPAGASLATAATADEAVVSVIGGPDAGASFTIGDGMVIGSGGRDVDQVDVVVHDVTVSPVHLALHPGASPETFIAEDLGSLNGTRIGGQPCACPTSGAAGTIVSFGTSEIAVGRAAESRTAGRELDPAPRGGAPTVPFNRPPRPAPPAAVQSVRVPEPPTDQQATTSFDLAALTGPIVIAAVMVAVLGSMRYAMFALMSPVMVIANHIGGRRRRSKDLRRASRGFERDVTRFVGGLHEAVAGERTRIELVAMDPATVCARAGRGSNRLWERRPGDEDDLIVRVGRGPRPWTPPVDEARVRSHPALVAAVAKASMIEHAAVEIDLARDRVVGIVGDRTMALALARAIMCQLAVASGPVDLGLHVLCSRGRGPEWAWSSWLPHAAGTRLEVAAVHEGEAASERASAIVESEPGGVGSQRRRLVVVDGSSLLTGRSSPVRRLLGSGNHGGLGLIIAEEFDRLPAACGVVVNVDDLGDAFLSWPGSVGQTGPVVIAGMSERTALTCARDLARFEDPELDDPSDVLPGSVGLTDLLGTDLGSGAAIAQGWDGRRHLTTLSAPIGRDVHGIVELDLVTDGPHVLVAGTTGAGKSELLRSLIAGLAVRHGSDRCNFVLVDYKGGSAFDACAGLPHVVGVVTDLDGHLAERALRSLHAELRRRESMLRVTGASGLDGYRTAGSPEGEIARLVVVIDEFATLAGELPDFLDALVHVAQRGRSLGVHLVLATQRPSGVVSADIRANTNVRIALRVQDGGDSSEIIGSSGAADIDPSAPGRALIRVGSREPLLVQTALSSASARAHAVESAVVVVGRVSVVDQSGRAATDTAMNGAVSRDEGALADLVRACRAAAVHRGDPAPRRPWIDMLATRIAWSDKRVPGAPGPAGQIEMAVADDPDEQGRRRLRWDPAAGHLGLFGLVGSGTTNALVATLAGAMRDHSPDVLTVYGFDHGGGALAALASFPHVGAVVSASDEERRVRLVAVLAEELARRRDAPADGARRIIIAIDQLAALLGELGANTAPGAPDSAAELRRVLGEGAGFGISAIITANRPAAVPNSVMAAISERMVFRTADAAEAAAFGLRERDLPSFVPGRAVHAGTGLVVQFPHFGADAPGVALRAAARWPDAADPPRRVLAMPGVVPLGAIQAALPRGATRRSFDDGVVGLPLGVGERPPGIVGVRLHRGDHLLVAGPARSGVSTVMRSVLRMWRLAVPTGFVVVVAPQRSPLRSDSHFADAAGTLAELTAVLDTAASDDAREWLVAIDEAHEITDAPTLERLAALGHCRLVVGGRADRLGGFGHWARVVRATGIGLLLQPRLEVDGDLLGVRLPRAVSLPLVPGRGFLVDRGSVSLLHAATPDAPHDPREGEELCARDWIQAEQRSL